MNQPPSGGNGGWPTGPKGPPSGGGGWPAGPGGSPGPGAVPGNAPPPGSNAVPPAYGPPAGAYGPPPGAYGPPPPAHGALAPPFGASSPPYAAPTPQCGSASGGPGPTAWPSPWAGSPQPFSGHVDDATIKAAAADPQTVFLAELLGAGFLSLPGIGHLMIGDVGMGLVWLLGYPLLVGTFWAIIVTFTCGIGGLFIFLQIPINFLVGYLLGERVKRRVLEAKTRTGRA